MQSFNIDNKRFHELASKKVHHELAILKGLNHNEDTEAIRAMLNNLIGVSGTVLEIGCGYGRVSDWLHTNFPEVNYTGIDFSESNIISCRKHAKKNDKTKFIISDVLDLELETEFDLILWPWSGFLELSNEDKFRALRNLVSHMKKDGGLLIDLPIDISAGEKQVFKENKIVEVHFDFGFYKCQIISTEKLDEMITQLGLLKNDQLYYKSGKGYQRVVLKITKPQ